MSSDNLKDKIKKNIIPTESPKTRILKFCRLGLIEPVHGVQATAHAL
jgi:hypothetical protein